jgi:hypothetical protein
MRGIKVVIPETGKVVIFREPQISDQEMAAQAVGSKAGDSQFTYALMLNKEMIRQLIVEIDGAKVDAKVLLSLDEHLTMQEYNRLSQVVSKLTGLDSPLVPKIESVDFGGK